MYSTGEKPITVIRNKPFNKPSHAPSISATSTCVCSTMTDWNSLLTASLNACAYTPQLRQCTTLLNCGGYWDQPPLRWILLTLQFRMTGCLERQRSAKPSIPKPEPTVDQVLVMVAPFSWWACGASCGDHRSQTQVWMWLCLVISIVRLWWGAGRARGGRFLRVFCCQYIELVKLARLGAKYQIWGADDPTTHHARTHDTLLLLRHSCTLNKYLQIYACLEASFPDSMRMTANRVGAQDAVTTGQIDTGPKSHF